MEKIEKYHNKQESNISQIHLSETNEKPILTKIEDSFNNEDFIKVQIKEKLNNRFFKVCESGDIDKVKGMMNYKLSKDRRPDVNSRYLHNYTVLHVSITNSIII
jgi:hypothetical protein